MADRLLASGGAGDTFTSTTFITGEKDIVTVPITVESGAGVVAAHSLVGIKTSGGKAVLSLSASGDGSEVPRYILPHEVDATSQDVELSAYAEGCFNPDEIIFGTGHTAGSVKEGLRDRGIYLKTPI